MFTLVKCQNQIISRYLEKNEYKIEPFKAAMNIHYEQFEEKELLYQHLKFILTLSSSSSLLFFFSQTFMLYATFSLLLLGRYNH